MDDKELEVSEAKSSTVFTFFTFSRKDVLKQGLRHALEHSVEALTHHIEDRLVDLVDENLQEEKNRYQFTLTVEKFMAPEDEKLPVVSAV